MPLQFQRHMPNATFPKQCSMNEKKPYPKQDVAQTVNIKHIAYTRGDMQQQRSCEFNLGR